MWVPLSGFSKYSVNPLGQVRHDRTDRLVVPYLNQRGAVYVVLQRDGYQSARSLPLLIARTFVPQPSEIFDTVINLDGDRFNCEVDNLAWRPRWFAIKYNREIREGPGIYMDEPVRDTETGEVFSSPYEAARRHGLLEREVIYSVINGTRVFPFWHYFETTS
jgi:hypothetical protein